MPQSLDASGVAMLHTDAASLEKPLAHRPAFSELLTGGFLRQIAVIYGEPTVYEVRLPIQRDGSPFGEIRIGHFDGLPQERVAAHAQPRPDLLGHCRA